MFVERRRCGLDKNARRLIFNHSFLSSFDGDGSSLGGGRDADCGDGMAVAVVWLVCLVGLFG